MRVTRRNVVYWIVGAVFLIGMVVATVRTQEYRYRPYLHDSLYLPSGVFLNEASLSYNQLVLIWCGFRPFSTTVNIEKAVTVWPISRD